MFFFLKGSYKLCRIAAVLKLLLLFSILFFSTVNVYAQIDGAYSWFSRDLEGLSGKGLVVPVFTETGSILYYAEFMVSSQRVRIRKPDGLLLYEGTHLELTGCANPTGVSFYNKGLYLMLFCGGKPSYILIQFGDIKSLRFETIATEESFFASSVPHPTPLVLIRGKTKSVREDIVFAMSKKGNSYCIGYYLLSTRFIKCEAANPIVDFYFPTWISTTDKNIDSEMYLIEERKTEKGIKLNSYILFNSSNMLNISKSAQVNFPSSSKVLHSNTNDADSKTPVIAYVQSSLEKTLKLSIGILNAFTLSEIDKGVVDTGITLTEDAPVTSAYLVKTSNKYALIVQTPKVIANIDYGELKSGKALKWVAKRDTTSGILFKTTYNVEDVSNEWHRRLRSPSLTDYNPYHVITSEEFKVISSKELGIASLVDGNFTLSIDLGWGLSKSCGTNDRMVTITAFETSLVYLGCDALGLYSLVDVSTNEVFYSISWPGIISGGILPFGYISGSGSVALSNGTNAIGITLKPLLEYTESFTEEDKMFTASAYDAGRFVVLASEGREVRDLNLMLYRLTTGGTKGGRNPIKPFLSIPIPNENNDKPNVFTAFFGVGKRFYAVAGSSKFLLIFSRDYGVLEANVTLSDCFNDESQSLNTVSFLRTVQHFGLQDDYHVLLGGTSMCLFEVNDTLKPRTGSQLTIKTDVFIGTTTYSTYVFTPVVNTLEAYKSSFIGDGGLVYKVNDVLAYVVGSNVFVYVKAKNIVCKSVRSDIVVWSVALPRTFEAPVVHMSYYNNTVFLVDKHSFYRFDVQYRAKDVRSSRVLLQVGVTKRDLPLKAATVGQGAIYLYSTAAVYAYDALTGKKLWETAKRIQGVSEEDKVELVVYSPKDVGDSGVLDKGYAYVELRLKGKSTAGEQESTSVEVYAQANGDVVTSILGTVSELTGTAIWGNKYNVFSSSRSGRLVGFRSLNLTKVPVPLWAKRPVVSITDVFVPGEPPINPLPEPFPRGDNKMAGTPPMTFSLRGIAALISPDGLRAVVGESAKGKIREVKLKCINVADPRGQPIREWSLFSGGGLADLHFLGFNNEQYILMTLSQFQFFAWSSCEPIGIQRVLTNTGGGLPSYISHPDKNEWYFLNAEEITLLQPSTGKSLWGTNAVGCSMIRHVGDYIICDGDSSLTILKASDGTVVINDFMSGVVTTASSGFAGVALGSSKYNAVYFSTTQKLFDFDIDIPKTSGKALGAIPGSSNTNVLVIFENLVASLTFYDEKKMAVLEWSNDLRGETAVSGAAGYIAAGGANIFVGTTNGMLMLNSSTGNIFSNISLKRRYRSPGKVQVMQMVPIKVDERYAFSWNGYVVLIESSPNKAEAIFSFGFGLKTAAQISFANNLFVVSGGGVAGIVPIDTYYWGAPVSLGVMNIKGSNTVISGWDVRNDSSVNLFSIAKSGAVTSRYVPAEKILLHSMVTGSNAVFFGSKSIASANAASGQSWVYPLPEECAKNTYATSFSSDASAQFSVAWYKGKVENCIFLLNHQGVMPSYLKTIKGKYIAVVGLKYGDRFGLLYPDKLDVIHYDGTILGTTNIANAYYVSSVSSPQGTIGIFLVFHKLMVTCYQIGGLIRVWNYTLRATSKVPVTYYNNSVFVSTVEGPYLLSLAEFTYPCPDRALFSVQREVVKGSENDYSEVFVNEEYGIAYVTTYGRFYAFDTITAKIIWERPDISVVSQAFVALEGMVLIVARREGGIIFLDPFTGASLLFLPSVESERSHIYPLDKDTIGFGGTIATALNLGEYTKYFKNVKANRPKLNNLPPYVPYNYNSVDSPNECSSAHSSGKPIQLQVPLEWTTAAFYGFERAFKTALAIIPGTINGWATSLLKENVYIARFENGRIEATSKFKLEKKNCDGLNLYPVSSEQAIVGIKCGGETLYYDSAGKKKKTEKRVAKNGVSTVLRENGYFVNSKNSIDGVNLKNLRPLSSHAKAPKCSKNFDLISLPKLQLVMFVCSRTGIMFVKHGSLMQVGTTITGGKDQNDFTTYDVDQSLGVGIACGAGKSGAYMVAFKLDKFSIILNSSNTKGKPLCGIRYPSFPNKQNAQFVFAYENGYQTWSVKDAKLNISQEIDNFIPHAITSHAIVYLKQDLSNKFYYYKNFAEKGGTVLGYYIAPVSGHMAIKDTDGFTTTPLVVIYGDGFTFAVDTSTANLKPLWVGNGNVNLNPGSRYVSVLPYIYTTDRSNFFLSLRVSEAILTTTGSMTTVVAPIGKDQRLFLSQSSTIGCVSSSGKILWNFGFSSSLALAPLFSPVVIAESDFALVSGGGRSAAIINKNTGAIGRNILFEKCFTSPESTSSKVIVNKTLVYIKISGWSCVHIVNLMLKNKSNKIEGPSVITQEISTSGTEILPDFPLWAKAGWADHFVFATVEEKDKKRRFTVYNIDKEGSSWTLLWSELIAADAGTVSTYGYFLFVSKASELSVYDMFTGRYVWGYIFESNIIAPPLGADLLLYVVTSDTVYTVRSSLAVAWENRLTGNFSIPKDFKVLKETAMITRTAYGDILFSARDTLLAFKHSRETGAINLKWISEHGATRFSFLKIDATTVIGLFDSATGAGVMDITSGLRFTMNNGFSSGSLISGGVVLNKNLFICSFFGSLLMCRSVPGSLMKPRYKLPFYAYDPESTEKTPENWEPIPPRGGGKQPLRPSTYCRILMDKHIPPYASCVNRIIKSAYPEGRETHLQCPAAFDRLLTCHYNLQPVVGSCLDVAIYIQEHWTKQTMNAASPLGLCNKEEAEKRCGVSDNENLTNVCAAVTMKLEIYNYENPTGYSIDYDLPVFDFPQQPIKYLGAILGGTFALIVLLIVAAVAGLYYYRKRQKVRDSRFFEDDDVCASLLDGKEGSSDRQMKPITQQSLLSGSKESSIDLSSVASRSLRQVAPGLTLSDANGDANGANGAAAPVAPVAVKGPGKMPPKMPMKMPGKMPPAKGLGPKMPMPPGGKQPPKMVISDDDL